MNLCLSVQSLKFLFLNKMLITVQYKNVKELVNKLRNFRSKCDRLMNALLKILSVCIMCVCHICAYVCAGMQSGLCMCEEAIIDWYWVSCSFTRYSISLVMICHWVWNYGSGQWALQFFLVGPCVVTLGFLCGCRDSNYGSTDCTASTTTHRSISLALKK